MSEISIDTLKTMLANLDDAKKYQSLRDVMETLPAPDLAAVFEDLPAEKLPVLFRLCPKDLAADVFTELAPETQQKLIDGLTDTELKAVVDELFVDDATDLVEEMPANVVKRILGQADPTTRRMINELLKYPEDSAGGVMTTELMELRPDMTVAQAMEAIRRNGFDKETINNCYVTDDIFRIIRHFLKFIYNVSTVSNRSFAASTASLLPNTTRTPFAMAAPSSAACSFSSAASTAHRALRSAAIISSVMPQKYRRSVSRASARGLRGVSSLATVPTIKSFRSFSVYSRAASSAGPFAKVS